MDSEDAGHRRPMAPAGVAREVHEVTLEPACQRATGRSIQQRIRSAIHPHRRGDPGWCQSGVPEPDELNLTRSDECASELHDERGDPETAMRQPSVK